MNVRRAGAGTGNAARNVPSPLPATIATCPGWRRTLSRLRTAVERAVAVEVALGHAEGLAVARKGGMSDGSKNERPAASKARPSRPSPRAGTVARAPPRRARVREDRCGAISRGCEPGERRTGPRPSRGTVGEFGARRRDLTRRAQKNHEARRAAGRLRRREKFWEDPRQVGPLDG